MSETPAELESGTEVFFEIGTGSVFRGEVVGREELKKQYAFTDYGENDTLVRVDIDRETHPSDDGLPDHMAPEDYQSKSGDGSMFRDSYTIDAEEQHYILRPSNLVEVL